MWLYVIYVKNSWKTGEDGKNIIGDIKDLSIFLRTLRILQRNITQLWIHHGLLLNLYKERPFVYLFPFGNLGNHMFLLRKLTINSHFCYSYVEFPEGTIYYHGLSVYHGYHALWIYHQWIVDGNSCIVASRRVCLQNFDDDDPKGLGAGLVGGHDATTG